MKRNPKGATEPKKRMRGGDECADEGRNTEKRPSTRAAPQSDEKRGKKEVESMAVDSTSKPKKISPEKSPATTKSTRKNSSSMIPQSKPSCSKKQKLEGRSHDRRNSRKDQLTVGETETPSQPPATESKSDENKRAATQRQRSSTTKPTPTGNRSKSTKRSSQSQNRPKRLRLPEHLRDNLPAPVDKKNPDKKPARWVPNFDAIPECLKGLVVWVLWHWALRQDTWTKPPLQPNQNHANVSDKSTWSTFAAVKDAFGAAAKFAGIGFVLTRKLGIVAIDVDHCIDERGHLNEIALKTFQAFKGTYWEVSPSGTGLRFLIQAKMPKDTSGRKNSNSHVECYCDKRYVTLTGHVAKIARPIQEMQAEFDEWYEESFPVQRVKSKTVTSTKTGAQTAPAPRAIRAIAKASEACTSGKFDRLISGDISEYDDDHSSADLAFCSMVSPHAGGNVDVIDECMRASGLYRDKWERRDYRDRTIAKAIEGKQELDDSNADASPPSIDSAKPFPIDALPEPVRNIAKEGAEAHGCSIQSGALLAMMCCAIAIQKRVQLELKKGSVVHAILWAAIIAESGSGKSPLLRSIMAPLFKLQNALLRQYKRDMADYERWLKQDSRRRNARNRDQRDKPILKQFFTSDATIEAILSVMSLAENFVAVIVDELGSWFTSLTRYSNSSSVTQWIGLYDKTSITVNRKTENAIISAEDAGACIVGTIQPKVLGGYYTEQNDDNGLVARFLPVLDTSECQQWSTVEIAEGTASAYEDLIRKLANLDGTLTASQTVRLSQGAARVFEKQFNAFTEDLNQRSGPIKWQLNKLKMVHGRIALILHCIDQALDGTPSDVISEKTMLNAVEISNWFKCEAVRVRQLLSQSAMNDKLTATIKLIRKLGGGITAAELRRNSRDYSSSAQAERDLIKLVDKGYGRWETIPKSRRFVLCDSSEGESTTSVDG